MSLMGCLGQAYLDCQDVFDVVLVWLISILKMSWMGCLSLAHLDSQDVLVSSLSLSYLDSQNIFDRMY